MRFRRPFFEEASLRMFNFSVGNTEVALNTIYISMGTLEYTLISRNLKGRQTATSKCNTHIFIVIINRLAI